MKRRDRAMIMIFVVLMVACIATVLAACLDLGRMAYQKEAQREREAKWQLCLDSSKALVADTLWTSGTYSQSFSQTVNNVPLTITSALDSWATGGYKISVSGTQAGKSRSAAMYMGKRATVNPLQFGLFLTTTAKPQSVVTSSGDFYYGGSLTASNFQITGNAYGPATSSPSFNLLTGSYIGRQPKFTIKLNDSVYSASASSSTSGSVTVQNPTNLLSLTRSDLRYHNGDLTIKGLVLGEITYYVRGSVTLQAVSLNTSVLSRLVVICNGDVTIANGTVAAFIVTNGRVQANNVSGARVIKGAVGAAELDDLNNNFTITYDNYFETSGTAGYRYWIPGQW